MKKHYSLSLLLFIIQTSIFAQQWEWSKVLPKLPGFYYDYYENMVSSSSGDNYFLYRSTNNFPVPLSKIIHIDPNGNLDSLTLNFRIEKFNIDKNGNYIINGSFSGSFSYQGQTVNSRGGNDDFLLKISPAGTLIFLNSIGSLSNDNGFGGIASDNSDKILVSLNLLGTTYANNDSIVHDTNFHQIALCIFNSDGSFNTSKVSSFQRHEYGYYAAGRIFLSTNGEVFESVEHCFPNECAEQIAYFSPTYDSLNSFYTGVLFHPGASIDQDIENIYYLTNPSGHYGWEPVIHKKRTSDNREVWQKPLGYSYSPFDLVPLLLPGNKILCYGRGGGYSGFSQSGPATFDDTTLTFGNDTEMLLSLMDTSGHFTYVRQESVPATRFNYAGYDNSGGAYLLSRWATDTTYTMGNSFVTTASDSDPDFVLSKLRYMEVIAGVNKIESKNQISIYPNPSKGKFNIKIDNISQKTTICVYDILGNCILSQATNGNEINKLDLSLHANGIYFVQIDTGKEKLNKKIVIN
ncbi:MAG: leucyl aminopeptidase [Bacteroidota bacterium]|jgi:hypothetical protein|nr:leucyl aminopeptidase [Bacteroidota bacterium]